MSDEPRETTDATVPVVQVTDKRRLYMDTENPESASTAAVEGATGSLDSDSPTLEQLQMQLEEREAQLARLRAQVVEFESKTQAELRETRRRLERTFEQRVVSERLALIEDWLAVFDNLDLMVAGAEKATKDDLLTGIMAMQRLLSQALQRHNIERIEAVGQPFDPQVHEAVETTTVSSEQDGQVVAQTRPGYRLGEQLIRPALVCVGRAETSTAVLSETEIPA
ncbi:MAG: nucleotide exchange factor GrpE [Chloracidobacterium sp.]|uniref:Protein GrpE n=1 Tax=Chloracidobacterium validum TaxID=2821543 RepID=A0ABX8BD31_9BACT|nr:nucleotide exchange factor GrpE [Chloracidobacterium validum]QUW03440.1 nucleotide exchange factor GrpE [Chloracidobacterium validum]